jgi:hypothetical protein
MRSTPPSSRSSTLGSYADGARARAPVGVGATERRGGALRAPHALRHEAVLGRTVKRLALRAHRFASAAIPLALLHEAHLSSAVKRFTVRAHRLAVAGLRRSRTDGEAGNQRC